ncbi:hypothetical protein BDV25DRAFT_126569 [Aspergillus avenaceus]|uniref:Arrestin-like N-terminal domain-containing protein n=1 Tax=Aspergillus avenaceus TaxID=36643 RepID=A0A5N6U7I3_ASPAV|nr:hypothetical protein BDV25DRAFT_126569 [Aspergillus avenaceus]
MGRTKPIEPELTIHFTEPAVFVPTYTNKPAVLRGCCVLKVKEPLIVKRLTVNFRGVSQVHWPHGLHDTKTVTNRSLTVFGPDITETGIEYHDDRECTTNTCRTSNNTSLPKTRLWNNILNRLSKNAAPPGCQSLSPGTYSYDFEMVLPPQLPESVDIRRGHVRYTVRARVECPGPFKHNIVQNKPIAVIHCPAEDFVEDAEPVYITRAWKRLLRCDILISRRGAPLCHRLPITVSFTELANARFHGLQIFLSENVQFLRKDGLVSCLGPFKRRLLYQAGDDLVSTLLPYLSNDGEEGQGGEEKVGYLGLEDVKRSDCAGKTADCEGMTLDIDLPLPNCQDHGQLDWMHFSTEYKSVRVNHWLEFVFSLSRYGAPIESGVPVVQKIARAPLSLRSCYAEQTNASLPAYSQTCDLKQSCAISSTETLELDQHWWMEEGHRYSVS